MAKKHLDKPAKRFIAELSHEINNPISYMLSGNQRMVGILKDLLLRAGQALDISQKNQEPGQNEKTLFFLGELTKKLEEIQKISADQLAGCQKIKEVVKGLARLSLGDDLDVSDCDLGKLIFDAFYRVESQREQREFLEKAARGSQGKGLTKFVLKLEIESPLLTELNPGLMAQVFENVFLNAMEAVDSLKECPQVSTLVCKIRTTENFRGAPMFEIEIADEGIGINEFHLARVFHEQFSTKKNSPHSRGVGLSLCREILGRHGGEIKIESLVHPRPGHGTRVTVSLPTRQKLGKAA